MKQRQSMQPFFFILSLVLKELKLKYFYFNPLEILYSIISVN